MRHGPSGGGNLSSDLLSVQLSADPYQCQCASRSVPSSPSPSPPWQTPSQVGMLSVARSCCSGVTVNSISFHFQPCPQEDVKSHVHPTPRISIYLTENNSSVYGLGHQRDPNLNPVLSLSGLIFGKVSSWASCNLTEAQFLEMAKENNYKIYRMWLMQ